MTTVIRAARLIDGTGAAPVQDAVLVVDQGKIVGTFAGEAPEGLVPADAEVLDLPGCTILPGLIDSHVHMNFPGNGVLLEEIMTEPEGVLVATATFAAAKALAAGVTTVRDTGCVHGTVFELRRALELGHGIGPRILACGQPITITGGHTWYLGGEADGEDGLRKKVRSMAKLGADAIKVMASGGGTRNTTSHLPSFSPAEMNAIVDEAHRMGRKVTAHCLNARAIEIAVEAGVDQLEHAGFLIDEAANQKFDPAVAEKIANAGVAVTSTLAVGEYAVEAMRAKPELTKAEQEFLDHWSMMIEDNLNTFTQLHEAGVRIVAGTDAGWRFTPIDGLAVEIELLERAGLSSMQALVAATGNAAATLGVEDKFGTLAPGLAADVLVVGGDPLENLSALRDVRLVLQGGKVRAGSAA
ncbi:amidohydrolase family protein [Amycolatopsis sp.]|uniref:amidohydrolase family protein n=1 Tax=Amycolatopsis sp. TaxID=37632 RepID=UPI002E04A7DE|nr:amidohydrolase family protein [Amycolatopsis sp.]